MEFKTFTRLFFSLALVMAFSLDLLAQKDAETFTAKNAAYLEIGGNAVYYSLNYERIFHQKGIFKSAARVGLSVIPQKMASDTYIGAILPLEVVGLFGRSRHHLEIGVGVSPYLLPSSARSPEAEFDSYKFSAIVPFRLGYRYQKPEGGFFFRIGYMPILDFANQYRDYAHLTLMHAGVSFGKSF